MQTVTRLPYAACKQRLLEMLIDQGDFAAFADGVRFVYLAKSFGL